MSTSADDRILCVIEVPKGSRNKYEWSDEHGRMLLDRFLSASVVFPTEYGFVPGTEGSDGDPLDILVVVTEATFPGCGILARPVAVLWLDDNGEREPKVVAAPCDEPNWEHVDDLDGLPDQLREEIEHFFLAYKKREDHDVRSAGWEGAAAAAEVVRQARERLEES